MALTREQALTGTRFHEDGERRKDGTCYVHRRNGATQTWKTRPADYRTPVKYGLKGYGQITPANAHLFHAEEDCPWGNQ
jgi:hypothetical protein